MTHFTISVIVPVFNTEKFLEQCIESVLSQDYPYLELILINDGSTDSSEAICKEYAKKDHRIKYFSQINQGVGAARNLGIANATGDYIAFLDSDDWLSNNAFSVAISIIERYNCDIYAYGMTIGNDIKEKKIHNLYFKHDAMLKQLIGDEFHFTVCDKIFKRECIYGLSFNTSLTMGEDLLFSWQAMKKASRIFCNYVGAYHYRLNEHGVCNSSFSVRQLTDVEVWSKIYNDTIKDCVLKEKAFDRFIITLVSRMSNLLMSNVVDKEVIFQKFLSTYLANIPVVAYMNAKVSIVIKIKLWCMKNIPYKILIHLIESFKR